MRKKVLALGLVLALMLGVTVQAASPWAIRQNLSLTFDEATAVCTANVHANKATDKVSITMKMWNGETAIQTWTASGTGFADLCKTRPVVKGLTYKLTLDTTINGVAQTTWSTTKTCPR